MTSLGPFEPSDVVEYLAIEYPVNPPFTDEAIGEFVESDNVDIWQVPQRVVEIVLRWKLYQNSNYREELAEFSGLEDGYVMLDDGVIQGDTASVDEPARKAAKDLVAGTTSSGSRFGEVFTSAAASEPPSLWERFRRGLRLGRKDPNG